jgi:hypothetical protein
MAAHLQRLCLHRRAALAREDTGATKRTASGVIPSALDCPQPLNRANRRPAARATRRRRNTACHRSVLHPVHSLAHRTPEATCAKPLHSFLSPDCEENESRSIASSARSGRNRWGNSVCHATTSARLSASRIRIPSPGKRRSYCACNRTFSSRRVTSSLAQYTSKASGAARKFVVRIPFIA